MSWKLIKICIVAFVLSGLMACGGEDGFSGDSSTSTTDTTDTTDSGDTTDPTDPVPVPTGVAGSISYVSASPSTISIKGTGGTEISILTFKVSDTGGAPLSGQLVNFSLNTTVGGITIDSTSATSDANGNVTVSVTSGTVGTVVSVTAALADDPTINTASSGPVISTGLPDQNSFSMSAKPLNPEAWAIDGETVTVTVRAADHFNNPVPDGSSVSFITEGGSIEPSCTITNGACSVTWTSQNPRSFDGRVTILATMQGEETFYDDNGNGVLDDADSYDDLPEAFLDINENGVRDGGTEEFKDFNVNGVYDAADGEYNGKLCNPNNQINLCAAVKSLDVRQEVILSMSASDATVSFLPDPLNLATSTTSTMTIADINGNAMPAGTTIELTSNSSDLSVDSSTSYTVPDNTTGPFSVPVTVSASTLGGSGGINVEVTSPSGVISYGTLSVNY